MIKPSVPFWLSILVIMLAAAWVLFPGQNLEPVIVLLATSIGIFPLFKNEFLPWLEHKKLSQKKFKYISGCAKINAIEPDFDQLMNSGGVQINLVTQGFSQYPTRLCAFFEQTNFKFNATFYNGNSIELKNCFSIGYETGEETRSPKKSNQYLIAQFDIDNDSIDELILGVIDNDSVSTDVELIVYKYHPPLLEQDVTRVENLECIGTLVAHGVVGNVNIELKKGSATIPRNHRGFFYKWAFIDGRPLDIGSY